MEAKEVDVSVSGDVLTIKGKKAREDEGKDKYVYCERYWGSYQRSFGYL